MTKKDYIAFARVIGGIMGPSERALVASTVAKVCQADNPRFSLSVFYSACNVVDKQ